MSDGDDAPVPPAPEAAHDSGKRQPTAQTHATYPWAIRVEGPRTWEEAIALVREHLARAKEPGLEDIPAFVNLVPSEDVPENADGCYMQMGEYLPDDTIAWEDCIHDRTGRIPVRIRPDVLASDERIVAVFAHELYEVVRLREVFRDCNWTLTAAEVRWQISWNVPGNLHCQAVAFGDRLVLAMRER